MKSVRLCAALGSVGLLVGATQLAGGIAVASAAPSVTARTALNGSEAPAAARTASRGSVAATSSVDFDLVLKLRNASSAQAALRAVSKPGSSRYHHYLTTAEWIAKYSPTNASVKAAKAWLKQQGFSVGAVAKDRLFVSAEGTAAQVEKAFSTSLGYYQVGGKKVRLANSPLSIPSSLGGFVSGVVGVNQNVATTSLTQRSFSSQHQRGTTGAGTRPAGRLPQPAAVLGLLGSEDRHHRTPARCTRRYTSPLPYDICGYKPAQLRGGYGLSTSVAKASTEAASRSRSSTPTTRRRCCRTRSVLQDERPGPPAPVVASSPTSRRRDGRQRGRVRRQRLVRRAGARRRVLALHGAGREHPVRRGPGLLRQQPARGADDRRHQRRLGRQRLVG